MTTPLLLVTHVVFTRLSFEQYQTHDTIGYGSGQMWST